MSNLSPRIIIFILIAGILAFGGYYIFRNGIPLLTAKKSSSNLADILFLTNPVNEISGKVDKISGNSVWISGKYMITPPPTPPNNPTAVPGQLITVPPLPPAKTLIFTVKIAPYTQIIRPELEITYLFNKNTPTPTPKLTVTDILIGQNITVSTTTDLRTATSKEIEAYAIKLPKISNALTGKIAEINKKDSLIILKATAPVRVYPNEPTPQPSEKEYSVSVTSTTEISRLSTSVSPKSGVTSKPQPVKYEFSDLKTDIQITVFTDTDVIDNQKLKALRIEPPEDLLPTSSSTTPSTTIAPKPTPKS